MRSFGHFLPFYSAFHCTPFRPPLRGRMPGDARFSYAFQIPAAQRNTPSADRRLSGCGRIWRKADPSRSAAALASQRRSPATNRIIAMPGSGWSPGREIVGMKLAASPPNPKSLAASCAAIVTMEEPPRDAGISKTAGGSARHWSPNVPMCANSRDMLTSTSTARAASACGSNQCQWRFSISLKTARRRSPRKQSPLS